MIYYSMAEQGVFSVMFSGPVTFSDIKEYLDRFKTIEDLPEKIRLLYDMREGEIDLAEEDLINIARLADEATEKYSSVYTAFLVSKPDVTAFTYIFSQFKRNKHSTRRVFSTQEAAINWLLNS
jgi:hypothetical protein